MMPNILSEIDDFQFKSNIKLNQDFEESLKDLYEDDESLITDQLSGILPKITAIM